MPARECSAGGRCGSSQASSGPQPFTKMPPLLAKTSMSSNHSSTPGQAKDRRSLHGFVGQPDLCEANEEVPQHAICKIRPQYFKPTAIETPWAMSCIRYV